MKADKIIRELIVDNYIDNDDMFTVPAKEHIMDAFKLMFGKDFRVIYYPHETGEGKLNRERKFVCLYDVKFPGRDKELYAILMRSTGGLIYIYEIE